MKTILFGFGVFCFCALVGAAMMEFIHMVREKINRENDHRH